MHQLIPNFVLTSWIASAIQELVIVFQEKEGGGKEKSRKREMEERQVFLTMFWIVNVVAFRVSYVSGSKSAVGDPGMRRDGLRVAFEAWNFCNEVGQEAAQMGSPRAADCFDCSLSPSSHSNSSYLLEHKVSEETNKLGVGKPFPGLKARALNDPDLYAAEKEVYLGSLCKVLEEDRNQWHFWMVMLKNGNFDTTSGYCPQNGRKVGPFPPPVDGKFPCFGPGCMNPPRLYHSPTRVTSKGILQGSFAGSYDLDRDVRLGVQGASFYEVVWEKKVGEGTSWIFKHKLKTSPKYPWLMLYLRADATSGFSGGYHYDTRGMLKIRPESPNFKVRLHLDVKQGGGPKSQFYLIDIGSCWKNNGKPCDGDLLTDVTRYTEMIINPETPAWCSPSSLRACPPYHIMPNNTKIHRTDTARFPYRAYHYYCGPGNAWHLEPIADPCDPYSNPHAQEIVQLLPHPVWGEYGYPTSPGQGWVGNPTTWELNVGGLSSRLYFYQDPGTRPARRVWTSIDTGTEIFMSNNEEVAEWTVSDFDVILT